MSFTGLITADTRVARAFKSSRTTLSSNATAANFGKLSDLASKEDLALGIINMVYETIGMMAVFAARMKGLTDIVLIGNLTVLPQCKPLFDNLGKLFSMNFIIPKNSAYGTVIGAALEKAER